MLSGGCHCGVVRYRIPHEITHHSLCHCSDCRRHAGAPVVAWIGVARDRFTIEGPVREYRSSPEAVRYFCSICGTGLFYANEAAFPGTIDVQTATLDEPERLAPTKQVQVAERIGWMKTAHELPEWERFPS